MNAIFEKLTDVSESDRIEDVVTVTRINTMNAILRMLAEGRNITCGGGLYKSATLGSVCLTSRPGHASGGKSSVVHWRPSLSDEGLIWKDGLINGVCADNIFEPVSVPKNGKTFLVADCTLAAGTVAFTITAQSGQPRAVLEDEKDFPPSNLKILLGICVDGNPTMFRNRNVVVMPIETRRGSSGGNLERYYSWVVADELRQDFQMGYYIP